MSQNQDPPPEAGTPDAPAERSAKRMTPAEREDALGRQRALGKRLKPMWDDVVNEPLPDDFLSLLDDMAGDAAAADATPPDATDHKASDR
jgi:hypothetical protein